MAKISELKKDREKYEDKSEMMMMPDEKLGGKSTPSSVACAIIEIVDNGYILRTIDPLAEDETVLVFSDRSEMLRELVKHI